MFNPILVHEFLSLSAKRNPDKSAVVYDGDRINYKDLDKKTDLLAQSLIDVGLKRHDRVIIFLDNCIEIAIAIYAVLKAGGVFVCLSASAKAERLRYTIKDSEARIVIADVSNSDILEAAIINEEDPGKFILIGDLSFINDHLLQISLKWDDLISNDKSCDSLDIRKAQIIDYDLATLVYTSGSTGEPKGVMSSHANMVSVSRSVIQYLGNTEEDIILSVLPVSFVYGLYQLIVSLMVGCTIILERSFIFPNKIINIIQQENVTGFPIIPTVAALLLKLRGLKNIRLNSLRYITNAGAALPVEHIKKLRSMFPSVKIFSMYGCAECLRIAYLPPDEIDKYPGSVGKAIPNCEVFVVNENCEPVINGEVGELVVRGSNVMRGYWKAPELTYKIFGKGIMQGETLLHTGDFFRQDGRGYLYFVCRKDDMIKTSGKKVSPKEIENVLYQMKGIQEASVIGVPDKILGQAVKAIIVLDHTQLKKSDILQYCAERLERFMVPKYIEFIERLPKTLNGKIDKLTLKKQFINT